MGDAFVGFGTMLRLGLRRDRWLLPLWLGGIALVTSFTASATASAYPDVQSRIKAATDINATRSLVALYGRVYDPTSLGALSLLKLTAFGAALVAVLMVYVTVRHTRTEEETGRQELLSGGAVGAAAPLAAAVLVSFAASVVVGLSSAGGLLAAGLPLAGSLAFGAGWAATGMAFAAVAAVAAQLTIGARPALGLGVVAIGITYALRAVGDLAEQGPSVLSWLSPIGWNQQLRAFAGDRWWVLVLPLGLCAALVAVAFVLRARRDLGAGVVADRPGPARGGLRGVADLAVRLHRGVLAAWAAAYVVLGLLLGSLASNVSGIATSSAMQDVIKKLGGEQALTDAFLAAELGLLGVVAAAYGLAAANRLRTEEATGHAEALLATATTRARWATSHYAAALAGVALLMLLAGLSAGVGDAVAVHDAGQVGRVTAAGLAQVPAAWVVTSAVLALFGWAPRFTGLVWAALAAFVALGEFGVLWKAPQWLMDVSPFHHSPGLPVTAGDASALVALSVTAAVLGGLGFLGWRRRDLQP